MLNRLTCLFQGTHDYEVRRAEARVYLECRRCGARTRGWHVQNRLPAEPLPPRSPLRPSTSDLVEALPLDAPPGSSPRIVNLAGGGPTTPGSTSATELRLLLDE